MSLRSVFLAASAALAAAVSVGAAQAQASGADVERAGGDEWEVVQRDTGCRIAARADPARPTINLPFGRGPSISFDLGSLTPAQVQSLDADHGTAYVDGSTALPFEVGVVTEVGRDTAPSYHFTLKFDDNAGRVGEVLSGADELRVEFAGRGPAAFTLRGLRPALDDARRCLARVERGLLGATRDTPVAELPPPRESPLPREFPFRWINAQEYPPEALAANEEGTTRAAVSVDRVGRPTACRIVQATGSAALDNATCARIMEKGSFYPAIGPQGIPVEGVWETAVNWQLSR